MVAQIRSDAEGAVKSGAQSTPTFYVEGGLIVEAGRHDELLRRGGRYAARTLPRSRASGCSSPSLTLVTATDPGCCSTV